MRCLVVLLALASQGGTQATGHKTTFSADEINGVDGRKAQSFLDLGATATPIGYAYVEVSGGNLYYAEGLLHVEEGSYFQRSGVVPVAESGDVALAFITIPDYVPSWYYAEAATGEPEWYTRLARGEAIWLAKAGVK